KRGPPARRGGAARGPRGGRARGVRAQGRDGAAVGRLGRGRGSEDGGAQRPVRHPLAAGRGVWSMGGEAAERGHEVHPPGKPVLPGREPRRGRRNPRAGGHGDRAPCHAAHPHEAAGTEHEGDARGHSARQPRALAQGRWQGALVSHRGKNESTARDRSNRSVARACLPAS
ncbi:unnamed protein product, partial [Prorocentrum cordatum]